jgi:hypothetical protein
VRGSGDQVAGPGPEIVHGRRALARGGYDQGVDAGDHQLGDDRGSVQAPAMRRVQAREDGGDLSLSVSSAGGRRQPDRKTAARSSSS